MKAILSLHPLANRSSKFVILEFDYITWYDALDRVLHSKEVTMSKKRMTIARLGGYSFCQQRIIAGISRYCSKYDTLNTICELGRVVPDGTSRISLETVEDFDVDGVLYVGGKDENLPDIRARLDKLTIPVVYAAPFRDIGYKTPCVVTDDQAVGRIMAEYFLSKGLKRFAFCTLQSGYPVIDARMTGFTGRVAAEGYPCQGLYAKYPATDTDLKKMGIRIRKLLQSLPKPAGVGVCYDGFAADVINIGSSLGIRIPEEVAVVGVGNDSTICDTFSPALSSVDQNLETCGFGATELLDKIMAGEPAPGEPILIAPRGVVQRESSDMTAINDPVVARCVHYIRKHVADGVTVANLLNEVHVSQSSLQSRFKKLLGHAPSIEIRHIQIEKARELLADPDLSMIQIAYACGFRNQTRFGVAFRRVAGQTPTAYRKQICEG